jgi:hypothetical protein
VSTDAEPTTRPLAASSSASRGPLAGPLDDYSPAGALGVLASTGITGAVQFTGARPCTVYLERGRLYFVEGIDTGDALAVALVRGGRITPDQWDEASAAGAAGHEVGERLIESGAVSRDLLASVALSVSYDPLIDLFRYGAERFDTAEGILHWLGPFRTFDVDAVMGEVRRRVREVDEMTSTIPTLDVVLAPNRLLPEGRTSVSLRRDEWELLAMLGRGAHLVELAEELGRGRWSTARIAHRLVTMRVLNATPTSTADLAAVAPQVDADPYEDEAPAAEVHPEVARALAESTYASSEAALNAMVEHLATAPPPPEGSEVTVAQAPPPPPPPVLVDATANAAPLPRRAAARAHMAKGPSGPADPAWMQSLYTSFEPDEGAAAKGVGNPVEAAFAAQEDATKSGTLRRLVDAIRRI